MTSTMKPERLREEDLQVGKPWVHPDTRLEYEDFHAYFCGKDPLPHWRNARIKEILAQTGVDRIEDVVPGRRCLIDELFEFRSRDGSPFAAVIHARPDPSDTVCTDYVAA